MDEQGTTFHPVYSYKLGPSDSGLLTDPVYGIFVVLYNTVRPPHGHGNVCYVPAPSNSPSNHRPATKRVSIKLYHPNSN